MKLLCCSILLLLWSTVDAAVYVVDGTKGDDGNTGLSRRKAFRTIQHCINQLVNPGDECRIAAGRYHEVIEAKGLRGTEDEPIKITGLGKDRPILDGTVPIQIDNWDFNSTTGVCSAVIEQDITALFLNEDLLTAARWPNAKWSDRSCFSNSFWGHSSEYSTRGVMIDNGEAGLAASGINANGTMAILNIGSWNTFVGKVLHHKPGDDRFVYDDHFGDIHWQPLVNQYYFEASPKFLDAPEEWYYDMETKVLHLIPPKGSDCPDPSRDTLRGRSVDYGLTIRNTTGLTVANLTFFACNVNAETEVAGGKRTNVDLITLDSIEILFGASSHRMLQSEKIPMWTKIHAKGESGKLSVINSIFMGSEGPALEYSAKNMSYIHNNLFAWNDWTGHMLDKKGGGMGTVFGEYGKAEGDVISHNTLWYNGASAGMRPGNAPHVFYNEVVGQCSGSIMNDGAGIQIANGPQNGAHIHHNWARDSPKMGLRFDGQKDQLGENGRMEFNVAFNCQGFIVKGENQTIQNNLALPKQSGEFLPDDEEGGKMIIVYKLRTFPQIHNNNSIIIKNGAHSADGGKDVFNRPNRFPLPGKEIENNYFGEDVAVNLYDPLNKDFRPLANSNFTDGDIIGPYLPPFQCFYWIPGRKLYKTSTPIPPSGSTVGSDRDVLMFLGAYQADSYHWYFGSNKQKVRKAGLRWNLYMGELQEGCNVLELPKLEANKVYYWRVDAQWGGYTYKGDIWSFRTN